MSTINDAQRNSATSATSVNSDWMRAPGGNNGWGRSASAADAENAGAAGGPVQQILVQGVRQLQALGRHDLVDEVADRILLQHDGSAEIHGVVASILDRRGDWRGSLAHLQRACALVPNAPQVRLNLALALLRFGNYRDGCSLYEARLDKPSWSGMATADSRATHNADERIAVSDLGFAASFYADIARQLLS